jgi:DHA3 family tetracycline resistance protein-like MFS transporter
MKGPAKKPGAEAVYLGMNAVTAFGGALIVTVLTVYYFTAVGLSPLQLVLVGTTLETACFLLEVPTGVVADTYSRRLSVILGMLILGAAFMFVGSVPLFGAVLLGQLISGTGYTFLSGATDAWLADEVGEANVGRIYLRSAQIERVVGLAGTLLSVGLASLWLGLPIIVGGALISATGLGLILFMPEHGFKSTPREARTTWHKMWGTFRDGLAVVRGSPVLLMLLGVTVFAGAASEGFDRLGDAHLLANFTFPALGALQPVVWFGLIRLGGGLISLTTTGLFRTRLEPITRNPAASARVLLVLNAVTVAAILTFALAGSFALAFAALMVREAVHALAGPLYNAWLVQQVQPEVRATVLSMVSQTDALGQIAVGPGIGAVGNRSLRAALTLAGLMLAPVSLAYARVARHHAENPQPVAGAVEP